MFEKNKKNNDCFISPKWKKKHFENRLKIISYTKSWPPDVKKLKKVFQTTFGKY